MENGKGEHRFILSNQVPRLKKRINIFIQRSDGRIHEASISDIDFDKQCVVVEWIENGETKGKSIEFPYVFELNPDLKPIVNSHDVLNRATSNGNDVGDHNNHVVSDSESDDGVMVNIPPSDDAIEEETDAFIPQAPEVAPVNAPSVSGLPGGQGSLRRPNSAKFARPAVPPPRNKLPSSTSDVNGTESKATVRVPNATAPKGSRATTHGAGVRPSQDSARDRKSEVSPRPSLPGNSAARMSNCTRQIKKLEQSRNERRLRLEEAKQEKQKQMNADPGNPNWHFLAMIRDYRVTLDFSPLALGDAVHDKQINVCIRKRPLNKKEEAKKEVDVITCPSKDTIIMHECKTKVDLTKYLENQSFRFDYAFDDDATNEMVYKFSAQPLIQTIFDGGMATCFAYGQTGSGKTHTMGGNFNGKNQDVGTGIYALAARDIFRFLQKPKYKKDGLLVRASFFEIYSGKVFDLLNKKKKLRILEDGEAQVVVCDLQEREVKSVEDVMGLIQAGNLVRTSGQTAANQHSSRSHAVFQITLRLKSGQVHGKFSFIDLAGNERGVDTMSTNRQTRLEGAEINKSLLALKECIRALARRGAHLPFRASKLTQVLRDSFIGQNSKTCMIAMISPGLGCSEHSLNTLRYANRVKELDGSGSREEPRMPSIPGSEDYSMHDTMSSVASDMASIHVSEEHGDDDGNRVQLETINALREAEDDVLEAQRLVVDFQEEFYKKMQSLNAQTNEVDYDVDEYAEQMGQTLEDFDEVFTPLMAEFRKKFGRFREELTKEEEYSRALSTKDAGKA